MRNARLPKGMKLLGLADIGFWQRSTSHCHMCLTLIHGAIQSLAFP